MKISHKLLLATLTPALLLAAVTFYANFRSQESLRASIERTSTAHARSVMNEIDRTLHLRIADWKAYVLAEPIQRMLRKSNEEFAGLQGRQAYIDEMDRAWRAEPADTRTSLMRRLLTNELSEDLGTRLTSLEAEYGYPVFGEVFITNRYGANVAQTNRTSDYRQDDEEWWTKARDNGVYIGDVGFDESAAVYSTDICLRIENGRGQRF